MITFNNIVERFKVFAENHFFVKSFSFGSPDDVDLSKFTNFPLMHLVYTGANYDAGTKTYNLEVYILDVPSDKTKKVDRQKEVVSDAEQCAEDIIADIKNGGNIFLFAQDYEVVNANTTPLEEETKNVLSGVLLDLSVAIPYEWDACNAPIDGVEPGGTEVTYARRGVLRMLTLDGATDVPSVRTIKVTNGTLTDNGDGVVTLDTGGVDRLSQLEDTNIVTPAEREALIYDGGQWVNDGLGKGDVGLANVDNTSDADKPVSTATQTALDAKADTSSVPTELNDLSDVTISGTPTGNQALIYDAASSVFRSADNFTNRFEDDVERGSGNITPFVERAYGVKSDGDGIFIDNQSDTPSAGKVIVRKIYHKAGLITETDVIGDYTLIHTFDDDTAYSATTSTFEGFRDGDTYGTPPFTLIQTWEEQTAAPTFTGLLNETYGSGAAAAYSVRRLNGLYTGAAIQVERSSDNQTQDIGFDANGDLDESALTTFCTGTVCKVRTWYDQSVTGGTGSGNDAVQTVHANQPTIYTGGAIVKVDGRVALDFDGTNDFVKTGDYIVELSQNSASVFALAQTESINGNQYLLSEGDNTSPYSSQFIFGGGGGSGTPVLWVNVTVYGNMLAGKRLSGFDYNQSTFQAHLDGNTSGSAAAATVNTETSIYSYIGSRADGDVSFFDGKMHELITYKSDKSTHRTSIESNIGDYFTQNTPLLDTYTGAAAAYSLRKLRTAYTGSAIRVRRSNDNAETDIGFNVFGELDTVSLASFCSGTNGFVKTWYDQSGSANDATQTTAANQPKIYDSSTGVVTENGKPAVLFSGAQYVDSSSISTTTATIFAVLDNGGSTSQFFGTPDTGENSFYWDRGTYAGVRSRGNTVYSTITAQIDYKTIYYKNDSSNHEIAVNNQSAVSAAVTNPITRILNRLGARTGLSSYFTGHLYECVIYASDQSSNRTNIEDNINTFYSIY